MNTTWFFTESNSLFRWWGFTGLSKTKSPHPLTSCKASYISHAWFICSEASLSLPLTNCLPYQCRDYTNQLRVFWIVSICYGSYPQQENKLEGGSHRGRIRALNIYQGDDKLVCKSLINTIHMSQQTQHSLIRITRISQTPGGNTQTGAGQSIWQETTWIWSLCCHLTSELEEGAADKEEVPAN